MEAGGLPHPDSCFQAALKKFGALTDSERKRCEIALEKVHQSSGDDVDDDLRPDFVMPSPSLPSVDESEDLAAALDMDEAIDLEQEAVLLAESELLPAHTPPVAWLPTRQKIVSIKKAKPLALIFFPKRIYTLSDSQYKAGKGCIYSMV